MLLSLTLSSFHSFTPATVPCSLTISQICLGVATVSSAHSPFLDVHMAGIEMREIEEDLIHHSQESHLKTLGSQRRCNLVSHLLRPVQWLAVFGIIDVERWRALSGRPTSPASLGWVSFGCSLLIRWFWLCSAPWEAPTSIACRVAAEALGMLVFFHASFL